MVANAYRGLRSWLAAAADQRSHNPEDAGSSPARPMDIGLPAGNPQRSAYSRNGVGGSNGGSTATTSDPAAFGGITQPYAGEWDTADIEAEDDAQEVAWCETCGRACRPHTTCVACGDLVRYE